MKQLLILFFICLTFQLASGAPSTIQADSISQMLKRAEISLAQGDYEKAEKYTSHSHTLRLRNYPQFSSEMVYSYINLARIKLYFWDYDSSLFYLQKADQVAKGLPSDNPEVDGMLLYQYAVYFRKKGDFARASDYQQQAHLIFNRHPDINSDILPEIYSQMAYCEYALGNIKKAEWYYQKCYSYNHRTQRKDTLTFLNYYLGLANIYSWQGDYTKCITAEQQALDLLLADSANNAFYIGLVRNNLGCDYTQMGDTLQAYRQLQWARHSFNSLRVEGSYYGILLESIAELYCQMGRYPPALEYIEAGLKCLMPKNPPDRGQLFPEANAFVDRTTALQLLRTKAKILIQYYQKDQNTSTLDQAIEVNLLYIRILEAMKQDFQSVETKLATTMYEANIYPATLQLIWQAYQNNPRPELVEKAFWVSDKSKASVLLGALTELDAKTYCHIPDTLLERERELKRKIAVYKLAFNRPRKECTQDRARAEEINTGLFKLQVELDGLIAGLEKQYPEYYRLKYDVRTVTPETIQSTLDPQTALIQYSISDSALYTFCITRQSIRLLHQSIDSTLHRQIIQYCQLFRHFDYSRQNRESFTEFCTLSSSLYKVLIEPVLTSIPGYHLIVIPEGSLAYVPFETLISSAPESMVNYSELDYLIKQHPVSYAYSSSTLFQSAKQSCRAERRRILAFAPGYASPIPIPVTQANAGNSLEPIPGTTREIEGISQLMATDACFNETATKKRFMANAGKYSILHLAMHTLIDNTHPLYSKLVFETDSSDQYHQCMLTTQEIFGMDLHAQMVVLSACSSGDGPIDKGEGIISLARGFAFAGVPSLIVSMWKLEDRTGTNLMLDFYQEIKKGRNKADALRLAKLNYLKHAKPEYAHPFFWSSVLLIGQDTAISTNYTPMVLIVSILAVLALLILWRFGRRKWFRFVRLKRDNVDRF